ncbi:hypothetical protein MAQ5080_00010 [Marinomonas aquimarina]|uniref:DUF1090 domain-containing protein n=1 Tax=Marinomonas aquimarina TaxID=295068 RepID=A0A1A8SZC1_9GAMM|nr:hypothetical protein [Marinomonas aquimarina]SBS24536.1 hypothetical protein MAQ5080_00010 [Marinomonas aquimarina]
MNTSTALKNTATMVKNGALVSALAAASLVGTSAYADDLACARVAGNEAAVEIAKAQEDWSEIFKAQAALASAKTECFIDEHITANDAEENWEQVKADFQEGIADLHDEFEHQVDNAQEALEDAKEEANSDAALAEAQDTYDDTMEKITDSYQRSVAALKDKLGINES